jgi:hypothetical protein
MPEWYIRYVLVPILVEELGLGGVSVLKINKLE